MVVADEGKGEMVFSCPLSVPKNCLNYRSLRHRTGITYKNFVSVHKPGKKYVWEGVIPSYSAINTCQTHSALTDWKSKSFNPWGIETDPYRRGPLLPCVFPHKMILFSTVLVPSTS